MYACTYVAIAMYVCAVNIDLTVLSDMYVLYKYLSIKVLTVFKLWYVRVMVFLNINLVASYVAM